MQQLQQIGFFLFAVLFFHIHTAKAQVMVPDSVTVDRSWQDNNGPNQLQVDVFAACNPDHPPYDGHPSQISVSLKNSKHNLSVSYNEEDYQMKMILFDQEDILLCNIKGTEAVFIPFSYCANSDVEVKVSYIIFHNNNAFIKHIHSLCHEDGSNCKLTSNLKKELKDMPRYLRRKFTSLLKENKFNKTL